MIPDKPEEIRLVLANEYWMLRRAARRIIEGRSGEFWDAPDKLRDMLEATEILRTAAKSIPLKPCKRNSYYGWWVF